MALLAIDPLVAIQVGFGAATAATPWVLGIAAGAHILTTLIYGYASNKARRKEEVYRESEDRWREEEYNDHLKLMKEETDRRRNEDENRQRENDRIRREDEDRRVREERRRDERLAEQMRQLKVEEHKSRDKEEIRLKQILQDFQTTIREEIVEKLGEDQKKRAEEEKRQNKLFDELKRLATEQEQRHTQVAETYEEREQRMERYISEQHQRHIATFHKNFDVETKVAELCDLIGLYLDYGKRYASNPEKMVAETERYQRDLEIQLKRVSNVLLGGEADIALLNIWANGAAHHIQTLRHLGREGLESFESVKAAVGIHLDTWKLLVSGFNNSTDENALKITKYFEELYLSKDLLSPLGPHIDGKVKSEL